MSLSGQVHRLWHETENILTAATGPLLIVSSAISTSDIFANQTFSHAIPQLPAIWAIARALAVTLWLGVAWEHYLEALRRHVPSFGWFLLSLILFAVDVQTATLFAFEAEHISNLGELAILQIPPIDWAVEQAVLGVILIAVHRTIIHTAQHAGEAAAVAAESPAPPSAPVAQPVLQTQTVRLVEPRTPREKAPRRDRGGSSVERERNIQLLVSWMRDQNGLTLTNIQDRMGVTRQTAVSYRDAARRIIASEV